MPDVVQFKASTQDQEAIVGILEEQLEDARAGIVKDLAVVSVRQTDAGPEFGFSYFGAGAYASLIAGVSALEFDLHFQRYLEAED